MKLLMPRLERFVSVALLCRERKNNYLRATDPIIGIARLHCDSWYARLLVGFGRVE